MYVNHTKNTLICDQPQLSSSIRLEMAWENAERGPHFLCELAIFHDFFRFFDAVWRLKHPNR